MSTSLVSGSLRRVFGATFALALLVRLAQLLLFAQTPFFKGLVVDAAGYAHDAQLLLAHGEPDYAFFRPPLYGHIRAGITLAFGTSPWVLGSAHAVASALACALVPLITFHLAHDPTTRLRAALIAGLFASLYGPLIALDLEMLPCAWVHLLLALSLWLCARPGADGFSLHDVLAALCLGLAVTGWAPSIVFVLLCVGLCARRWQRGKMAKIALFVLAVLGPSTAVAAHNFAHGAPGVFTTTNAGINLWLGNGPHWRETWRARPGLLYEHESRRAQKAGANTPRAEQAFFVNAVLDEALANPGHALRRTLLKLYYFWHGREIRRDLDFAWHRAASPLIRVLLWEHGLLFPFGLLLPLTLLPGCERKTTLQRWAILGVCFLYGLTIALFFPSARYRLPIVFILIPLAATQVATLGKQLAQARPVRAFLPALVVLVAVNWPNDFTTRFADSPAEAAILLSQAHRAQGDIDAALTLAERAVLLAPQLPDAHFALGQLLLEIHAPERALPRFERAAALFPGEAAPWVLKAHALIALNRLDEARMSLQQALVYNPHHDVALRDLAITERILRGATTSRVSP